MSKVAVLSVPEKDGVLSYVAAQGDKQAVGATVGKALDALMEQFPMTASTIVIVQGLQADAFFGVQDQQWLTELMERWHLAQAKGKSLPEGLQEEAEDLIEKELKASEHRASALARALESKP